MKFLEPAAQLECSHTQWPTHTFNPTILREYGIRGIVGEVRDRLSAAGAKVDATDGVRVSTADRWRLLRASNTQDVLVARAEATGQAGLERLMTSINDQLEKSGIAPVAAEH